jgi:hypothetical protein
MRCRLPVSGWLLAVKEEHTYGGELCGTVTPPSADCESSILRKGVTWKRHEVGLLAPRLAASNIVGRTAGVEPYSLYEDVRTYQKKGFTYSKTPSRIYLDYPKNLTYQVEKNFLRQ